MKRHTEETESVTCQIWRRNLSKRIKIDGGANERDKGDGAPEVAQIPLVSLRRNRWGIARAPVMEVQRDMSRYYAQFHFEHRCTRNGTQRTQTQ